MARLFAVLLLASLAACGTATSAQVPDPFQVRALLIARDFDALEVLLDSSRPEAELEALYGAFATTDPALVEPLEDWVHARNDSAIPLLARAYFAEHRQKVYWRSEGRKNRPRGYRHTHAWSGTGAPGPDAKLAMKRDRKQTLAMRIILTAKGPGGFGPDTLDTVISQAPNSPAVYWAYLFNLGSWFQGWGHEGNAFLRNYVRSAPNQTEMRPLYGFPHYAEAWNANSMRKFAHALAHVNEALSNGEHPEYLSLRIAINAALHRHQDMLLDYDRLLQLAPYDAEVLDWRAQLLYWQLDDPEAAYAGWDLALRLDPLNPRILTHRADALYKDERYDEAMADLEEALAYNIGDPSLHHRRAQTLIFGLEDYRRALEETALSLSVPEQYNPVWGESWYLQGYALDKLGDCAALPAFDTYVEHCAAKDCNEERLTHARARLAASGPACPH